MLSFLSRFSHRLWLETQLNPNPIIQKLIVHPIHDNKEWLRTLGNPTLPIVRYKGHNKVGPLTLTHVGTKMTSNQLLQTLFSETPQVEQLGDVPFWKLLKADKLTDESDILAIEADVRWLHRLNWERAFVLPPYILMVLDLQGTWDEVNSLIRSRKSVRKDLNKLERQHNFSYEISHSDEDFDFFYEHMYLPSIEDRHGDNAVVLSKEDARCYFQHGFLFKVMRDDQLVLTKLMYPHGKELVMLVRGILHADETLMNDGVVMAADYLVMQWGHAQGYERLNFMRCVPYLSNGVFRYKRKWGSRAEKMRNDNLGVWITIQRDTPAVQHYLLKSPMITFAKDTHKLQGLIFTDEKPVPDDKLTHWHKLYETPGLESLQIRNLSDFLPTTVSDRQPASVSVAKPSM